MSTAPLTYREARPDEAGAVATLVRVAYRGEVGWTTEAAFLDDERIDAAGVLAKLREPDGLVLVGLDQDEGDADDGGGAIVACCELVHRGDGLVYFGMFAVDPARQASGLGREVLARAEEHAVRRWGADTVEMTVIAQRTELIAWYVRRGYTVTGETRPFPYDALVGGGALRDDLFFRVLVKSPVPGFATRIPS